MAGTTTRMRLHPIESITVPQASPYVTLYNNSHIVTSSLLTKKSVEHTLIRQAKEYILSRHFKTNVHS